jgi:hypothetical protein
MNNSVMSPPPPTTMTVEAAPQFHYNLEELLQSLETEVPPTAQTDVQRARRRNVNKSSTAKEVPQLVKKQSATKKLLKRNSKLKTLRRNSLVELGEVTESPLPDVMEVAVIDADDVLSAAKDAFDWFVDTHINRRVVPVQEQLRLRMFRSLMICCLDQYLLTHECGVNDAYLVADCMFALMQKYKLTNST